MTILVLALDALDSRLVQGYDSLTLNQGKEIDTFANMKDVPFTLEVWPSVVTGEDPRDHGITKEGTSSWDNPLIDLASKFTGHLPHGKRNRLGNIAEKYFGAEYTIPETDSETIFDEPDRVVHNWPGVHRNRYLLDVWRTLNPGENGQTVNAFEREIRGIGAEQFGWACEMLSHDVTLAGVHIHTIDMGGHIYFSNRDRYEGIYQWVDAQVEEILYEMSEEDELVILSDHGMAVGWFGDEQPGVHNWHAYASTTMEKDLFDSVLGFREWLEPELGSASVSDEKIDYDEEHLRDLGYIQ